MVLPSCVATHAPHIPPALPLQTVWLLQALHQDQPNNQHIRIFRERCMAAALTGSWVRRSAQQEWVVRQSDVVCSGSSNSAARRLHINLFDQCTVARCVHCWSHAVRHCMVPAAT
jgi:hypothetical protein